MLVPRAYRIAIIEAGCMPELEEQYGIKRICQNCAARYYDLNNDPPVCPSCGTEYDPEAVMRSRRGRVAAAALLVLGCHAYHLPLF